MKVAFICGSLEPGLDGVGDYTRKIAAGIIRGGHEAIVIAINDRYVLKDTSDSQDADGTPVNVWRICAKGESSCRFRAAEDILKHYSPDWVSLQYVSYALNKRGLTFNIGSNFAKMKLTCKWHIMFHEIWQGESSESTTKDRVIGFLQKNIAVSLCKKITATVVTTTNDYYQNCLRKTGISSNKIPVFSNMPVGRIRTNAIYDLLPSEVTSKRNNYLIASFFGRLDEFESLYAQIDKLHLLANTLNKELILTHIGRSVRLEYIEQQIRANTKAQFYVLGEWNEQAIADYLALTDFGVSTYPRILYEKSGSIAAMLNNGLPVVTLKDSFEKDKRSILWIKHIDEITDFASFINQDKNFTAGFSLQNVVDTYFKFLTIA